MNTKSAPKVVPEDWRTPTKYVKRFTDAVTLLCVGHAPTKQMVTDWLSNKSEALQGHAASYGPAWAQGIVVLDAARILADSPTEGVDHEML